MATANLVEALEVSERVYGLPVARAAELIDPLLEGPLTPISLDAPTARRAAEVRAARYRRARCPISLADAILVASAAAGDRLATPDPCVLAVAEAAGIETLSLPGQSRGAAGQERR